MEMVIFNPQKGGIETIDGEVNETHTPWFVDEVKTGDSCASAYRAIACWVGNCCHFFCKGFAFLKK